MIIPLWSILSLLAAILAAAFMLIQEHAKLDGFVAAYWNKIYSLILAIGPMIYFGLPEQPHYYFYVVLVAALYAISDVVFFNVVQKTGAGTLSRVMPLGIIITFCLWLAIDHALFIQYLNQPIISSLLFACVAGAAACGFALKKCEFSWGVIRSGWFVIFAGIVGNILVKLMSEGVDPYKFVVASVGITAFIMLILWTAYFIIKKPVSKDILFSKRAIKWGFFIGLTTSLMVTCLISAIAFVENPAYSSAVYHLSAVFIIFYYRLRGYTEKGNVKAGLGIVFCAVALILLKSI